MTASRPQLALAVFDTPTQNEHEMYRRRETTTTQFAARTRARARVSPFFPSAATQKAGF